MIVEGCDILLDVNQMFVRQGKKASSSNTLSSCFPKDPIPHFPRMSIDFPRKTTDLFTNEDSEEKTNMPRSQRSHSTVSCLAREQQLAAIGSRRRLSSLRHNSLVSTTGIASFLSTSLTTSNKTASTSNITIPSLSSASTSNPSFITAPITNQLNTLETRRLSDTTRIRKKSVRISDDSFDECEEIIASNDTQLILVSELTPEDTPVSSPKEKYENIWRRPSALESVEEKASLDSFSSEEKHLA